eukprot:1850093-Prorocentrum_lima.AAC.1
MWPVGDCASEGLAVHACPAVAGFDRPVTTPQQGSGASHVECSCVIGEERGDRVGVGGGGVERSLVVVDQCGD